MRGEMVTTGGPSDGGVAMATRWRWREKGVVLASSAMDENEQAGRAVHYGRS